ncbi:MAG: ACT domain-containing protein [Armatimonadota bacterium]
MLPEEVAPIAGERVSFERERGVSAIVVSPEVAYLVVRVPDAAEVPSQRLAILHALQEAGISIFLIKLQRQGLSFGVRATDRERACRVLEREGFEVRVKPHRVMVSVFAQNMRELHGVLARIAEILYESGVAIEQISDAHDRLTCLIEASKAPQVVAKLRRAFHLREQAVHWLEGKDSVPLKAPAATR